MFGGFLLTYISIQSYSQVRNSFIITLFWWAFAARAIFDV